MSGAKQRSGIAHEAAASRPRMAVLNTVQAKQAGLRYVSDAREGIRRQRRGERFVYLRPDGVGVGLDDLRRIRSLAIPPAWRDVWICPRPDGHLQAVGWDAKGRKQYRYHPDWRTCRDGAKYVRLKEFGESLPAIRRCVARDLAGGGLTRDNVLSTIVRLLDITLIRVGNDVYAKQNGSFGLTTMRDRHVSIHGSTVRFSFRGKSGVAHLVELDDRHLAGIIRQSRDLPGYELFQYLDHEGRRRSVHASDVNAYLKRIARRDITAKDFRTWAGTVLAVRFLRALPPADSKKTGKRNVVLAIESVAKQLHNTKAVCRKCYIDPRVLDLYLEGRLSDQDSPVPQPATRRGLSSEERFLLHLLSPGHRASLQTAA